MSILIRPYRSSDKRQVHRVFSTSMKSLESARFRALLKGPLVSISFAIWSLIVVCSAFQQLSWLRENMRYHFILRFAHVLMSLAMVAVALVLPLIALRRFLRNQVDRFLDNAIKSDLGDIEAVYGVGKRGDGIFLVAEQEGGKIVGTVGAEPKGNGVFELRRLSVLTTIRKQGVASRLIKKLEEHVKPKKMYLSCSNIQSAAIKLYEKNGFRFVRRFMRHTKLLNRQAFHFSEYEKVYDDEVDAMT
jgi:GNAT superfamily N-acetyltransferase